MPSGRAFPKHKLGSAPASVRNLLATSRILYGAGQHSRYLEFSPSTTSILPTTPSDFGIVSEQHY